VKGDVSADEAVRRASMDDVLDKSDALTYHLTLAHRRPPLPVEADASRVRLLHKPTIAGAIRYTVGLVEVSETVTLTAETLAKVLLQLLVAQDAFKTPPFNARVLPGTSIGLPVSKGKDTRMR